MMKTPKELREEEEKIINARKERLESLLEEVISEGINNRLITSHGGIIDANSIASIYDCPIDIKIATNYLRKYGWSFKLNLLNGNTYKLQLFPTPELEEHSEQILPNMAPLRSHRQPKKQAWQRKPYK